MSDAPDPTDPPLPYLAPEVATEQRRSARRHRLDAMLTWVAFAVVALLIALAIAAAIFG